MNDRDDDLGLKELEARLKQARLSTDRRNGDGPENSRGPARGVGFAARIGTDILAALVVGLGLGWFLDRWLGTAPFAMMVFFVLGAAAGIRNAYRLANRTMGEIDAEEKADREAGGRDAADQDVAGKQPDSDKDR
ncbi:ATP synthase protein I [Tistrella bauzanensis]|uniref:ATP synthase protein I n=1 Tax=Tistrella bauzanensis TaxID=657419 RepID=A0ABQ1I9G1_9PROT|nr:AtpZ/AtpI family protein [Tistrella bauzanensis]GGB30001.1 ATP synthase protein I [Tistrella bauzanensis]